MRIVLQRVTSASVRVDGELTGAIDTGYLILFGVGHGDTKEDCRRLADKVMNLTKEIVKERKISCLMVTHNMHQALDAGNRTLMMADGRIVLDVSGETRAGMVVEDLLEKFARNAGKALDNDRILLS